MKFIVRHKILLFAILISCSTYVLFYGPFLTATHYFWGSDAEIEYVPARAYLYDQIVNHHTFPFWTERLYSGFPIYADLENSYLNPVNVGSILVFGPEISYKVLHVAEYLLGSLSLFFLLRRKGMGLLGFAVGNVIYYFNTFSIDHQIHFNIVMAFFLIPTALLLTDLFLERRKTGLIVLQSLVLTNAVLWGHMQSAIIVGMGVFAYMAVLGFRKMRLRTFTFYFLLLVALVFVESFPQILPTFGLFGGSSREVDLDYLKGSLTPSMAVFSFVPYLLGGYVHFQGKKIDVGFTYTEIYTYLGLSSVLLAGLAIALLRKSRDVVAAYVFIWIFLIFSFLKYNHLVPAGTPLLTLFRDWERTVALSSFGVAFLAALFIENIRAISPKHLRMGAVFLIPPVVYLFIIERLNADDSLVAKMAKRTSLHTIVSYGYFPVLAIITGSIIAVVILYLIIRKFIPAKVAWQSVFAVQLLLACIVFFDLVTFSKDVLEFRLKDISDYKVATIPAELANRRVVLGSVRVEGMESLYYDSWSPFGYSQFEEKSYIDIYKRLGLGDIKKSYDKIPSENFQQLVDIGIVAISRKDGTITHLTEKTLDLIRNDLPGEYVEKTEGRIVMRVNNPADSVVRTYLKYDPNWRVDVDGTPVPITRDGIFFSFPLSGGEHVVTAYYFPRPLYVAISVSLIAGVIIAWLLITFRKPIREKILR